jgi:hypothetical protein
MHIDADNNSRLVAIDKKRRTLLPLSNLHSEDGDTR